MADEARTRTFIYLAIESATKHVSKVGASLDASLPSCTTNSRRQHSKLRTISARGKKNNKISLNIKSLLPFDSAAINKTTINQEFFNNQKILEFEHSMKCINVLTYSCQCCRKNKLTKTKTARMSTTTRSTFTFCTRTTNKKKRTTSSKITCILSGMSATVMGTY